MKRRPPDINALLEAITEAKPLPPPPPWMTRLEIMAEIAKGGPKVPKGMAPMRVQKAGGRGKGRKRWGPQTRKASSAT